MVKQGDIIKVSFNPQKGHEQAGVRPALVISNDGYHRYAKLSIVCPITNTEKNFPLHVKLDERTKTTGFILCEHIRTLDLSARNHEIIESIPIDILQEVLSIVQAELEIKL